MPTPWIARRLALLLTVIASAPAAAAQAQEPSAVAAPPHIAHIDGPITIEREISGPKQDDDIRASKAYLEKLIG